ncbi:MAG: DNA-directed RNA polymerase subunit omega [Calditrichota bacterium]
MPAKTQDIRKLLEITGNLYEAALVMGRRARQINEEMYQKKRDRQILEELEGGFDEDFLQIDGDEADLHDSHLDEENPIIQAERNFLKKHLKFEFPNKKEEE